MGNARVVFNEAGTILQTTDYYPFGLEIDRNSPVLSQASRNNTNRYNFLGRETQVGVGYIDLQARFYDPTVGRFLGVDPITEGQEAFSPYHYSFNNPILYSDPDGKYPDCCGPAVEGFAQGVKEAVVRNIRAVTVDLPQTVQGMASLTTMSGQLEAAVGGAMLYDKTKSDWTTGDTRTQANIIGNMWVKLELL